MRHLLNTGSDDERISVIQQRANAYRMTVETSLLFNVFHADQGTTFAPAKIDVFLEDGENGSWKFRANNALGYTVRPRQTASEESVFTSQSAVLQGRFDPNPNQENILALHYRNSVVESHVGAFSTKQELKVAEYELRERSQADHFSDINASASVEGAVKEDVRGNVKDLLFASSASFKLWAEHLDYQSLKGKLRFGDRLELHTSEGDADYPTSAVRAMRRFLLSAHLKEFTSLERGMGIGFGSLNIYLAGKSPDQASAGILSVNAGRIALEGRPYATLLKPFVPDRLVLSGKLAGIDMRELIVRVNPLSRLGINNRLAYFNNALLLDQKVALNEVSAKLDNKDFVIYVTGGLEFDLGRQRLSRCDLLVRSADLEHVIAVNSIVAQRDRDVGMVYMLLNYLKGLGDKKPDGTYEWKVTSGEDGKILVNGFSFRYP